MKTLSFLEFNHLLTNKEIILITTLTSSILLFTFIIVVIIVVLKKAATKGNNKDILDIANLILTAIGKDNISDVSLRNKRLEVIISDLNTINKELLVSAHLGATLTGNIIKFSLNKNANVIYKELKDLMKG